MERHNGAPLFYIRFSYLMSAGYISSSVLWYNLHIMKSGENIVESMKVRNGMKNIWLGIIAVSLLVMAGLSAVCVQSWMSRQAQAAFPSEVTQGYAAVFLTNGQVYFGKIGDVRTSSLALEEIYYLQSDQPQTAAGLDKMQDLKLIKLGNELHGPKDRMIINREHVLFIESLQDESKVSKAIKEYKK